MTHPATAFGGHVQSQAGPAPRTHVARRSEPTGRTLSALGVVSLVFWSITLQVRL